jgi:hypothetical protein
LWIDRRNNTETSEELKLRLFKALSGLFGPPSPNHEEQKDQSYESDNPDDHCIPSMGAVDAVGIGRAGTTGP